MNRIATYFGALALLVGGVSLAHAAAFTNGSFETGTTSPGSFTTLYAPDTSITGWTVIGAGETPSIDYIGSYWTASDGVRSLDLSGLSKGGVSQTFDTVFGQQYSVSFDVAGNPDKTYNKVLGFTLSVGPAIADITFVQGANTKASMGWLTYSYSFVANAVSTTLSFLSKTDPDCCWGPALDNVRVSAVPIPAALPLLGAGLVALGAFARRRRPQVA
jgi:choice-of-anchor C domain-containing protein